MLIFVVNNPLGALEGVQLRNFETTCDRSCSLGMGIYDSVVDDVGGVVDWLCIKLGP